MRSRLRYRKHDRTTYPEGVSHTSPGQRPGNRIPENKCVLKEHRIGRPGSMSETRRLCGVPSERRVVLPGEFPGLHPGLVCDTPSGSGFRVQCLRRVLRFLSKLKSPSPTAARPCGARRTGNEASQQRKYPTFCACLGPHRAHLTTTLLPFFSLSVNHTASCPWPSPSRPLLQPSAPSKN